jgi:hypothetical protein
MNYNSPTELQTPNIAHIKFSLCSQTFNSTELHSIILMPQYLCSQAHILAGWRLETQLTDELLCHFYNPSARTAQKTQLFIVACIRFRGNVFTQLFHSNGCTRHISYRDNSSIVSCGHYLAAAVSLAPQFLLWANTSKFVDLLIVVLFLVWCIFLRHCVQIGTGTRLAPFRKVPPALLLGWSHRIVKFTTYLHQGRRNGTGESSWGEGVS